MFIWTQNPAAGAKMAPYVTVSVRTVIIDLRLRLLKLWTRLCQNDKIAASGPQGFVCRHQERYLFVKQLKKLTQPYVVERWIGGMLTNGSTIAQQVKLKES